MVEGAADEEGEDCERRRGEKLERLISLDEPGGVGKSLTKMKVHGSL